MRKTIILLLAMLVSISTVSAFSFEIFGYTIAYEKQPEIIDEVSSMRQVTSIFDEEIKLLNSFKKTQLILKNLDYNRIGLIDTSTGKAYTIVVKDGIILHIEDGLNDEEVIIKANVPFIKKSAENNNLNAVFNSIEVPFRVKLRLFFARFI